MDVLRRHRRAIDLALWALAAMGAIGFAVLVGVPRLWWEGRVSPAGSAAEAPRA